MFLRHFALVLLGLSCLSSHLGAVESVPVEGGSAEEKATGLTWNFKPDPALPNVLIIGDSISIGYTLPVRAALAGTANVFRPLKNHDLKAFNCGDTARGLENLDDWLGDRTWRVIHLNFGLHDLKYMDAKGTYVTPDKGTQVATLAQYEANLHTLITRLKKTGAMLIWASTTPVPEGAPGRVKGDEVRYNTVASKVMEEEGVTINDLCAALQPHLATMQRPKDVHFTSAGSRFLADAVVAKIRAALAQPPAAKP